MNTLRIHLVLGFNKAGFKGPLLFPKFHKNNVKTTVIQQRIVRIILVKSSI